MTKPKVKKCWWSKCPRDGNFKGEYFVLKPGKLNPKAKNLGMVRETRPLCDRHYQENTFGLWPFCCASEKCRKARAEKIDVPLERDDMVVWIRLEAALHEPLPKCPWCSKTMRPATDADLDYAPAPRRRKSRRAS